MSWKGFHIMTFMKYVCSQQSELTADSPNWYSTFGIRIFMTNHPHHHHWV